MSLSKKQPDPIADDFEMNLAEEPAPEGESKHKEQQSRDSWGGKAEFLFSCLSYAVGLGNVWRFPYLCYKNGGGAFLLPFICMLVTVGIPLLYMETCFGQYSATGPITVWKASPLFTGIGWSMIIITFCGSIYYNMLIAWTMFYFWQSISSVTGDLPWTTCSSSWNTGDCVHIRTLSERNRCRRQGGFFAFALNHSCLLPNNASWVMESSDGAMRPFPGNDTPDGTALSTFYDEAATLNSTNTSLLHNFLGSVPAPKTSSDEYFHNFVLSISNGFHEMGLPKWELVLCLLASWIVVILCLIRGVKSAGKAVYFTGLFPYLVLTILLIRGLTLEGSSKGLEYFFIPNWDRLADAKVWGDAAMQVFFSLASGWGGIIALSSYNKFHNNALLDSLLVSLGDGATSIYAGMTVFCVLGYMSHVMSVPIDEVAKDGTFGMISGAGLAFILYPDIVTSMPVSPLWAALFFGMLLTLGFGTMIANVNTLVTSVCDNWSRHLSIGKRPFIVLCAICLLAFVCGLPCTTRGGMFVLQLLDNYSCTYSVLVVGFLELVVITWVYGADNFLDNIEEMNPFIRKSRVFWRIVWQFFSPLVLVSVAIFTFTSIKPSKYGLYEFPPSADITGWVISMLVVMPIPGVAIYKVVTLKGNMSLKQKIHSLMLPHRSWGREMGKKVRRRSRVGNEDMNGDGLPFETSQQPLTNSVLQSVSGVSNNGANIGASTDSRFLRILRGGGVNMQQQDTQQPDLLADTAERKRDSWGGKAEFLFSCISYAVGLGNVWRFPYLCYKNGGGAFLLPFLIMLLTVGIPLLYMETCFGQYSATGPITVWKASPLFTGIGWSMIIITFCGSIYYNMLIAWTMFYFWQSISSVTGDLPWTTCSSSWNTGDCVHIRTLSERNRCRRQG
uniref:Transporter n=1 Tax=Macrostomum lignano TaxID=282301 RepID=A0A1I8GB13_9PLAT